MAALERSLIRTSSGVILLALVSLATFAEDWDPTPKGDVDAGGDKRRVPIVFVHGGNGAGEQFERQAMHFTSNGYPGTWIAAFDYSTAGAIGRRRGPGQPASGASRASAPQGTPSGAPPVSLAATEVTEALDKFIDEVRKRTGHAKVNLVGHSFGTLQSARYLNDSTRAAKIAHYASMGGGPATNQGGVPSIAVSGIGDFASRGQGPRASNGGVTAKMPDFQDHVMVCTSDEAFEAIYTFFNDGEKPKTMKIEPQAEPLVSGVVKSYVNNQPLVGAKIEVWEVAQETGRRTKDKPLVTFVATEDGRWGPFRAQPGQYYEFVIHDKALARPRHVYREPFYHNDRLVYFRISAAAEGYAPSPLDKAPKYLTDENAVFNVRHQNGALLPGIMSLSVNGTEVCTDELTPASTTTVALYVVDGNENGKSEFTKVEDPAFTGPFIRSVDMYIPADPPGHVEFKLNKRVLNVPNWKGAETGQIQVVFDDYR
ncbi:MAG: alpha/beta fold hydrolase [Pirellulales bacterium]